MLWLGSPLSLLGFRFQKKRQVSQDKGGDKAGTGLRHFSMMVCQKVEERGTTTYGEVADVLISELQKGEEDVRSPFFQSPHS